MKDKINIKWTEEMLEFLRDCAEKKMSGSAIAALMTKKYKVSFTRNSIIGKSHREKIVLQRTQTDPVVAQKLKKRVKAVKKEIVAPVVETPKIIIDGPFKNPRSVPTTLLDLVEGQCKYPTGDVRTNDLYFCGAPADSERSRTYCRYCYPILYQPLARYRENKNKQ